MLALRYFPHGKLLALSDARNKHLLDKYNADIDTIADFTRNS